MSRFLSNIIARSLQSVDVVQPLIAPRFATAGFTPSRDYAEELQSQPLDSDTNDLQPVEGEVSPTSITPYPSVSPTIEQRDESPRVPEAIKPVAPDRSQTAASAQRPTVAVQVDADSGLAQPAVPQERSEVRPHGAQPKVAVPGSEMGVQPTPVTTTVLGGLIPAPTPHDPVNRTIVPQVVRKTQPGNRDHAGERVEQLKHLHENNEAQSDGGQASVPTIHVTIGRIDIRAVQQAPVSQRRAAPSNPTMSLDDYLNRRNEGKR